MAKAHGFGLQVGVDVPIAELQQHGWYMVKQSQSWPEQKALIDARVDWLHAAGFDYLVTESGFSEFTHPSDTLMLQLMNELADYAMHTYSIKVFIKCHCSAGQVCKDYKDPRDPAGLKPLDFNFLPMLASENLGVLPHTVQAYGLDDPTAGVYNNYNFEYMLDWMLWEVANSTREVVFHPETNYWVNVDIDVPLFLPVYGARRVHDLRLIASEMERRKVPAAKVLTGQLVFDSGWEFASWTQDVITARAMWGGSDVLAAPDDAAAFVAAAAPLSTAFGGRASIGANVTDLLWRVSEAQERLLMRSNDSDTSGAPPPTDEELKRLSGFAYVSGLGAEQTLLGIINLTHTQPARIGYYDHFDPLYPRVLPLIKAIAAAFGGFEAEFAALVPLAPAHTRPWLEDMADAMAMTARRAAQNAALYAAAAPEVTAPQRDSYLNDAKAAIAAASAIVSKRESLSAIQPASRIYGWRPNPTAYSYGYVWTVHSLYYWWRDLGLVLQGSPEARLDLCYLNTDYYVDVVLGGWVNMSALVRELARQLPGKAYLLGDCLGPPEAEYVFPRDL